MDNVPLVDQDDENTAAVDLPQLEDEDHEKHSHVGKRQKLELTVW